MINAEGCGCGLGGAALRVSGGTARVWNLVTMEGYELAVKVTGGEMSLLGAAFQHNFARIEGGTATLNGVLFRDAGDHVTIQGGSATLWGNLGGRLAFKIVGTPASAEANIRR